LYEKECWPISLSFIFISTLTFFSFTRNKVKIIHKVKFIIRSIILSKKSNIKKIYVILNIKNGKNYRGKITINIILSKDGNFML